MKYYLDTNVLYNIRKIKDRLKDQCFYSVFGLQEIVAGVNDKDFGRRKATLKNIIDSGIHFDRAFVQEILFNSFDFFKAYSFSYYRFDHLFSIVFDIIDSKSYHDFYTPISEGKKSYDFTYFVEEDSFLTANFSRSSAKGIATLKALMVDKTIDHRVHFNGEIFDLSTKAGLVKFLQHYQINIGFTKIALASEAKERLGIEGSDDVIEQIFTSYNGSIDIYLKGFSEYLKCQTINDGAPIKNDMQDLIHVYYLQNDMNIKLISDDRMFRKYIPDHVISLEEFLSVSF